MAKTEMKKDREAKGIFKDTAKSDTIKRVLKHIGAYRCWCCFPWCCLQ